MNTLTREQVARVASTGGWGEHGAANMSRYLRPILPRSRRRCFVGGCGKRATHVGMANGVALCSCCEWDGARWVKGGYEGVSG